MAAPLQDIADTLEEAGHASPPQEDAAPAPEVRVGLRLAAARKAKGLNHVDIHAGTKIKLVHIAAIEAGQAAYLPATPFTAGFVKAYAQFLGLDGEAFAKAYKDEAGFAPTLAPVAPAQPAAPDAFTVRATAVAASAPAPVYNSPARSFDADKLVTIIGAGAALAVVIFIAFRAFGGSDTASPVAAPAPTAIVATAPTVETVAATPPQVIATATEAITESAEATVVDDVFEETPPAIEVAPPPVKPARKKVVRAPAAAEPAPVEATPAPILFTTSAGEPSATPLPAHEALLRAAAAAETAADEIPAEPLPVIEPARVIRGAAPVYPERCASRAGEKIAVTVIFSVTPEGRPVSASVIASDNRCFNAAAQRAVYDMRFSPRTVDGVPAIETGKSVTVQFVR